jgi:hypothetical protein
MEDPPELLINVRSLLLLSILFAVVSLAPGQNSEPKVYFQLGTRSTPVSNGDTTVYTLKRTIGQSSQDLWSITVHDKYVHHWIASNGTVWVLSTHSRATGSATIWARNTEADRLGQWNLQQIVNSGGAGQTTERPSFGDVDQRKSIPKVFGTHGRDQFDLYLKSGLMVRYTIVNMEEHSPVRIVRMFPAGKPVSDLLTEALSDSEASIEWPVKYVRTLAVWRFPGQYGRYLLNSFANPVTSDSTYIVTQERKIDFLPSYVARTPVGRVVWFEFGYLNSVPQATLRLMDKAGREMAAVDLGKLTRGKSAQDLKELLMYQSIGMMKNGYPVVLDSLDQATGPSAEVLYMSDRTGLTYRITLTPTTGTDFTVKAESYSREKAPDLRPSSSP